MRAPFAIAVVAALIFAGPGFAAEKKKKAEKANEFPGQPVLNKAVKKLAAAQKEVQEGSSTLSGARASLEEAEKSLTALNRGGKKGSAAGVALQYTRQAIKALDGGLKDDAARHIDKALDATRAAGEASERK